MCHEMPQAFRGGGGGACAEKSRSRIGFCRLSPSVWRGRRFCAQAFLRKAFAQLCVRLCGRAWCARFATYDHARFSRGALVAQGLGMRVDTLLHRLAVERCGWGCGVGTAVGSYAPSLPGITVCVAVSPALCLGLCVQLWKGVNRPVKAPVQLLWWENVDHACPQAACCACGPRAWVVVQQHGSMQTAAVLSCPGGCGW